MVPIRRISILAVALACGAATATGQSAATTAPLEGQRQGSFRPGQPTGLLGSYLGQTPPGTTPVKFAPGIVSMDATTEYGCTWSPDGREFYFTRAGKPHEVMVSRLESGGWTFPEPAAFSAGYGAFEPHVTLDNHRVYWAWSRPVPNATGTPAGGSGGIWTAVRTPAGWSEPRYAGQGMYVTSSREGRLYVTDTSEAPNGYLATVREENGVFTSLVRLTGGMERLRPQVTTNVSHPAIAPDGSYLVFGTQGGNRLHVCFRQVDGSWGDAIDLTAHGLDARAGIASISPDGRYLFFGRAGDLYWVSTDLIEGLRPRGGAR